MGFALFLSIVANIVLGVGVIVLRKERDDAQSLFEEHHSAASKLSKGIRQLAENAGYQIYYSIALAVALAGCCSTACGQEVNPPPEDGGRCHLTVVTHDQPHPHERQLLDLMARDPNLAAIRKQCIFHHYTGSNPLVRERLHARLANPALLPAVMLQRPDGGVLYLATGENVPTSAVELYDQMAYYSKLAPPKQSSARDSFEVYGAMAGQCGPDGCGPGPCGPDGCRPYPDGGFPDFNPFQPKYPGGGYPDGGGYNPGGDGPYLPDSAEMIPRRNNDSSAAAVLGVCGAVLLLLVFGMVALGIVAAVVYALTRPR